MKSYKVKESFFKVAVRNKIIFIKIQLTINIRAPRRVPFTLTDKSIGT